MTGRGCGPQELRWRAQDAWNHTARHPHPDSDRGDPDWGHSRGWGYGPSGIVGVLLIVVIILLLTGRI
jgi:hypothetical protein